MSTGAVDLNVTLRDGGAAGATEAETTADTGPMIATTFSCWIRRLAADTA